MRKGFFVMLMCVVIAVLALPTTTVTIQAQEARAWATTATNIRVAPGVSQTLIATLDVDTLVFIEGRDQVMDWILVRTEGGLRGWGKARLFRLDDTVQLRLIPVSTEKIDLAASPLQGGNPGQPTMPPGFNAPEVSGSAALAAPYIPRITPAIRTAMRAVVEKGKQLGNNPRVFSKVGDCMTDHWMFLSVIGNGQYSLGEYAYLQEVIDWFNVPSADRGNSWNAASFAAHNGFNSSAVLETQFANPSACQPDERPLMCEYRINKPGVAIIMFGAADVLVMTPRQFYALLKTIVLETLDAGVVPLLSTFPENPSAPEQSRQINQLVLALAREKSLPVMNFADAARQLPNNGLQQDGIHLTEPPGGNSAYFSAENLQYGFTLRNLLVLQSLDVVMKQILR
ncbi:MAG: hypothetical protein OHK0023_21730 [Anaerolineae bacterium]